MTSIPCSPSTLSTSAMPSLRPNSMASFLVISLDGQEGLDLARAVAQLDGSLDGGVVVGLTCALVTNRDELGLPAATVPADAQRDFNAVGGLGVVGACHVFNTSGGGAFDRRPAAQKRMLSPSSSVTTAGAGGRTTGSDGA